MYNTHNYADHFPRRANVRVDKMAYSVDIDRNGKVRMELGVLPAADTDGIVDGESINAAVARGATGLITGHRDNMGKYGRNVTVVLSGAGTPAIVVHGLDYLGQPMSEAFTGAGAVAVAGKKAFKEVTGWESGAVTSVTIDIGYGNVLGLPYAITAITEAYVDEAVPTAGTVVAAVQTDPQTATTGDPRGTYAPHASFLPDASRDIILIGTALEGQYHGVAHYAA